MLAVLVVALGFVAVALFIIALLQRAEIGELTAEKSQLLAELRRREALERGAVESMRMANGVLRNLLLAGEPSEN